MPNVQQNPETSATQNRLGLQQMLVEVYTITMSNYLILHYLSEFPKIIQSNVQCSQFKRKQI